MKPLNLIALGALTAPVFALGLGTAAAEGHGMGAGGYLSSEPAQAIYADDLIGNDVHSTVDDESIGSISDLILDQDGQVVGVVIGVGGFLGIGAKDVAMEWDSVELQRDEDGDEWIIRVDAVEEALEDAPEYERN